MAGTQFESLYDYLDDNMDYAEAYDHFPPGVKERDRLTNPERGNNNKVVEAVPDGADLPLVHHLENDRADDGNYRPPAPLPRTPSPTYENGLLEDGQPLWVVEGYHDMIQCWKCSRLRRPVYMAMLVVTLIVIAMLGVLVAVSAAGLLSPHRSSGGTAKASNQGSKTADAKKTTSGSGENNPDVTTMVTTEETNDIITNPVITVTTEVTTEVKTEGKTEVTTEVTTQTTTKPTTKTTKSTTQKPTEPTTILVTTAAPDIPIPPGGSPGINMIRGQTLTLVENLSRDTIHWKQGSVLGIGGNRQQTYNLCEYETTRGQPILVFIQASYGQHPTLTADYKLQYGIDEGVLFLVYHDKSQTPYQSRFAAPLSKVEQNVDFDKMRQIWMGEDVSWLIGDYLQSV